MLGVSSFQFINIGTIKCKWRRSRMILVIIRSHNVNKSQRKNYMYRHDVSVGPTLAGVMYKQIKMLRHFVLLLC